MILFLYASLQQIERRIRQLKRRCNRMEAALEMCHEITKLKLEMVKMKVELDKVKSLPTQIIIQKLENKIDNLDVTTLNGVLNIGVAQNQSGAVEGKQLSIGGKPIEESVSGKKEQESAEKQKEQHQPEDMTQGPEHCIENEFAEGVNDEFQNEANTCVDND